MTNDPDIPPPPWQRAPDRPSRRRRDPISRDAIVAAAIGLLDREGLAALSMRRLAEELGTGAASLYWHVGSKDGLLDLVLDEVIGEGKVPDPDPELDERERAPRGLRATPGEDREERRCVRVQRRRQRRFAHGVRQLEVREHHGGVGKLDGLGREAVDERGSGRDRFERRGADQHVTRSAAGRLTPTGRVASGTAA